MEINSVNTVAPSWGATQPTITSRRSKIADEVKSSNPIQPHPDETDKPPEELNNRIDKPQTSMGFVLNKGLSDHVVAVIKDKKTGETIRLVPSEEQLKIKNKMADLTGLLLDQIV